MKRNLVLGAGLALTIAVALLANCRTARAPSASAAASTSTAVPPPPRPASAPVTAPEKAEVAASEPASEPTASTAAPTGADRLAERRGLERPETTPALEAMRRYERDEMVLIAQIQKRTKRAPPPTVDEIVQARRSGASFEELWALASRKLGGDAEMLLAVRAWLNEVVRPRPLVPDGSEPPEPRGAPLELGGSIAPK